MIVIAKADSVLRIHCLNDGSDRPKAFLIEYPHIRRYILQHCGLVKVSLMGPAGHQHGAFGYSILNLAVNDLALLLFNERPDDGILLVRIPYLHGSGIGSKRFTERVVYRLLHNQPGCTHAYLSLMEKCSESRNPDSLFHVKIL